MFQGFPSVEHISNRCEIHVKTEVTPRNILNGVQGICLWVFREYLSRCSWNTLVGVHGIP